ncbi:MAG: glycoside hydrolase [Clostridia bacterium]|nr:glycoside hydrolase [Clostridia bacterium]
MGKLFKVNDDLFADDCGISGKSFFLGDKAYDEEKARMPLPDFREIKHLLPVPFREGHNIDTDCYMKAFEIAFGNLKKAKREAGFVSDFIDTAFNGYLFMWDSSFIMMFTSYADHIFDFQATLDNFYSHQHRDGFICREICEDQDGAQFTRDDPASTGPNVLPWAEWEHYLKTRDKDRLAKVFDPLCAYHRWVRNNRSWQDGSYFSCGLACGMDNQPRQKGYEPTVSHGFMSWIDATSQACLSAETLIAMSKELGRDSEPFVKELEEECKRIKNIVNERMWDEKTSFYYDTDRRGKITGVKTIGAYWALLAGIVPEDRAKAFAAHLDDEGEFKRPVMIPTLPKDDPHYRADGGYWLGGVWAPTNYMVLKGLEKYGMHEKAHEIAKNYVAAVTEAFAKYGSIYENYAPEEAGPGSPAKSDFVGWSGLGPVAILFEYVFGIKPKSDGTVEWRVFLTDAHGIKGYRLGANIIDLYCAGRGDTCEKPEITIKCTLPVKVRVIWEKGEFVCEGILGDGEKD